MLFDNILNFIKLGFLLGLVNMYQELHNDNAPMRFCCHGQEIERVWWIGQLLEIQTWIAPKSNKKTSSRPMCTFRCTSFAAIVHVQSLRGYNKYCSRSCVPWSDCNDEMSLFASFPNLYRRFFCEWFSLRTVVQFRYNIIDYHCYVDVQ